MSNQNETEPQQNAAASGVVVDALVRRLRNPEIYVDAVDEAAYALERMNWELLMVSKLAADTPQFFNPLNAGLAKRIRDRVLAASNAGHDTRSEDSTTNER